MDRELIDCIDAGTEYCPSVIKKHHFKVKKIKMKHINPKSIFKTPLGSKRRI